MLSKFSVQGFKNFKDEFTINFKDVRDYKFNENCIKDGFINKMMIYGKNSVGKSNLGYAMFDIVCHLTEHFIPHDVYEYYLNAEDDTDYAEFKYRFEFNDDVVCYEYKKVNNKTLLYEKLIIDDELIFEYNFLDKHGFFPGLGSIGAQTLSFDLKDEKLSVLRYIASNSDLSENSPIKKMMRFVSKMLLFKNLQHNRFIGYTNTSEGAISYIIKHNAVDEFEEFLKNNGVNSDLIVREDPTGEKVLYFDFKKPIPFIQALSSGTLALTMFFYWYKHFDDVSFLFVDEFDAFYHFELSRNIIEILKDMPSFQTIITSHNTELLSNRFLRPDCFFVLTKEKIVSLVNATKRELREGHNLEKLFKSGEFDV